MQINLYNKEFKIKEFKIMEKKFDIVQIVTSAAKVPGVKIKRDDFLRDEFSSPKYKEIMSLIIEKGPVSAGVPRDEIKRLAKGAINFETTKVTMLSAAAGIPGGLAMIGTIPADLAQFYAHVLRIIQKLMYLYGWEDIGSMNDETRNVLLLFLGAMSGVQAAEKAIADLCKSATAKMTKTIVAKALTKTTLYPIIKKICATLGIKLTKKVLADWVAKAVPLIGAFTSGGLTLATFKPMSHKLLKLLDKNS